MEWSEIAIASNVTWDTGAIAKDSLRRLGYIFYVMNPWDNSYEKISDVRDYNKEVTPVFFVTILLEQVFRLLQNKPIFRYNDTICNACHAILMEIGNMPLRGIELAAYCWVYNNYRLIDLPWDSAWTWVICWFVTDFCYYWMHRLMHEINILWAIHEPHHTPEDMVLSAPLRNNMFLIQFHWITYFPMCLIIPPTTYLVHYQISIIYQFWLHNQVIDKLPSFIESFMCTPSNHRVHHGRNKRYIDKNYGGYFVIWDKLFGTYVSEDENDRPVFGTVKQMDSFNPLVIQTRPFINMWKKFKEQKTIGDKISVIFKGPGWSPGKSWTGDLNDIPEPVEHIPKYDPVLPLLAELYVKFHFGIFINTYTLFTVNYSMFSNITVGAMALHFFMSSISFGFILDKSSYALSFEFLRCFVYFLVDKIIYPEVYMYTLASILFSIHRMVFGTSLVLGIGIVLYEHFRITYKEKTL